MSMGESKIRVARFFNIARIKSKQAIINGEDNYVKCIYRKIKNAYISLK